MPRDASGNYTLPAGNPVVSGTIIETNWANPTMADLASEMTDSLSRSGEGGMLAPLLLVDGSAGAPSLAFLNNTLAGLFYDVGSGRMTVCASGAPVMRWGLGSVQQISGGTWYDILNVEDLEFFYTIGPNPTLADAECGLTVGTDDPDNDPHLAFGPSVIQAKSSGTAPAALDIQPLSGDLNLGAQSGSGEVYVYTSGAERLYIGSASRTYLRAESGSSLVELVLTDHLNNDKATFGFINGSPELAVRNDENSGDLRISVTDAGGVPRTGILLDTSPSIQVLLYFGGASTARTVASADGGLEVNNQETGAGYERVLTESDGLNTAVIASDQSIGTTTPASLTGWDSVLPNVANAVYAVDGQLRMNTNGTGGLNIIFAISAGFDYDLCAKWNYGSNVITNQSNTLAIDEAQTVSGDMAVSFTGTFRIGGSPSGNQGISFAQLNGGSTASTIIRAGSWIRFQRVS